MYMRAFIATPQEQIHVSPARVRRQKEEVAYADSKRGVVNTVIRHTYKLEDAYNLTTDHTNRGLAG